MIDHLSINAIVKALKKDENMHLKMTSSHHLTDD